MTSQLLLFLTAFMMAAANPSSDVKDGAVVEVKVQSNPIDWSQLLKKTAESKPEENISLQQLPLPISGNATALIKTEQGRKLYVFNGLVQLPDGKIKLTNEAWYAQIPRSSEGASTQIDWSKLEWRSLQSVPSVQKQKGRYVTTATVLNEKIYLLGGYSTNRISAPNRQLNEQNVSDFYSFTPEENSYVRLEDLPVPVDDTVVVPMQDRYLYVISGWHKDGPVNLVQVFDSYKNEWFQASPLPFAGAFGHAGGGFENQLLICDGQSPKSDIATSTILQVTQGCWLGEIDLINPSKITWRKWVHPSEQGRFRMASVTDQESGDLWMLGGATRAFDLYGQTFDPNKNSKIPTTPSSEIWRYSFNEQSWRIFSTTNPVMDTPNAIIIEDQIMTIGGRTEKGMTAKPLIHR